jgi:hypothetical protein
MYSGGQKTLTFFQLLLSHTFCQENWITKRKERELLYKMTPKLWLCGHTLWFCKRWKLKKVRSILSATVHVVCKWHTDFTVAKVAWKRRFSALSPSVSVVSKAVFTASLAIIVTSGECSAIFSPSSIALPTSCEGQMNWQATKLNKMFSVWNRSTVQRKME